MRHRRLDDGERAEWEQRFFDEKDPMKLIELFNELWRDMEAYLFMQPNMNFALEGFVAARTATTIGADAVHLVRADRPDCVLCWQGKERAYEIVEVDQRGRRRGDEYRRVENGEPLPAWSEQANDAGVDDTLHEMRLRIEKKCAKGYAPEVGLLVYLNLVEMGFHWDRVKDTIIQMGRMARKHFPSVLVLWQSDVFCFDETGEYCYRGEGGHPVPMASVQSPDL